MNNELRSPELASSDIRLVDAAVILVRQWVAFILGLSSVLIFGLFYAATAADKYEFVSLYQLAEESSGKWLQQPALLVVSVEDRILPQYESAFRRDNGRYLPFGMTVSSSEKSGVLSVMTIAEDSKSELIEKAHRDVISGLEEEQRRIFNDVSSRLESEVSDMETALEEISEVDSSLPYLVELYRNKAQAMSELNDLGEGKVISVAQRSVRPIDPNRKLIVVGSIIGGIFLGIVLAFLCDFWGRVRSALREDI